MESRSFYNEILTEHNIHPEFKHDLPDADLVLEGVNPKEVFRNTICLSSDVNAAYDPTFASVYDPLNSSYVNKGCVLTKYTGARGKSGSNDANAEYLAHIRNIFEKENIHFQTAELGRVDVGGGGTIAYLMSVYGMEVIDSGVAVLGMHAPWETTSKADVYEAVRCYEAFLKAEF